MPNSTPRRKKVFIAKPSDIKPATVKPTPPAAAAAAAAASLADTVPDTWDIDTRFSTPVLFFSKNDTTLATIPLTEELLSGLTPAFNRMFITDETDPVSWIIRYPEADNSIPLFSLLKKGKIMASIPLTQEMLAELSPVLEKIYKKPSKDSTKILEKILKWVKAHKFWTFLLSLVLIPVIASMLLGVYTQIVVGL
jgi:hypothetical protein